MSGLNQLTARRVYEFRQEHGPFGSREQLTQVPGIGEATFVQAAGFLRIVDGENPLDATWIHPESYPVARDLLARLGSDVNELSLTLAGDALLPDAQAGSLSQRAEKLVRSGLAEELGVGELLLRDLISALTRPSRDPREDLLPPVFRQGVMKLDDLKPGMELRGTVLNVVDFGVFVDVGVSDSALVHISRLQNRFVLDPHQVVSVGDVMTVWVVEVDKKRRRVSLTAIPPGSETPNSKRPEPQRVKRSSLSRIDSKKTGTAGRPIGASKPHRRPASKPSVPISDAMVDGSEPLRSFADLLQYYEQKKSSSDSGSPD